MSVIELFLLLPILALSSPTPPKARDLTLPIFTPSAESQFTCTAPSATNVWSGITALQPPHSLPDPNAAPIPIQAFTIPNTQDCELFAHFSFQNVGTNTIGNTQTIALPSEQRFLLAYMLDSPTAPTVGGALPNPNPGQTQKNKRQQLLPILAAADARISSIKAWISAPPPANGGYTNIQTTTYDTASGNGMNGTMEIGTTLTSDESQTMVNCHFEVKFTGPGAVGTIGLYYTGALAEQTPTRQLDPVGIFQLLEAVR